MRKLLFEEHNAHFCLSEAFRWNATELYRTLTRPEFGIEHYQTDIIIDILGIYSSLIALDAENHDAYTYRHAIGTRTCGTFNAASEVEYAYFKSQCAGMLGIELEFQRGCGTWARFYQIGVDEAPEFLGEKEGELTCIR